METHLGKVTSILTGAFPAPALINVTSAGWGSGEGTFIVFVVTDAFQGKDEFERQRMVWKPLRDGLSLDECLKIELVVTSTMAEEALASAVE